MLKIDVLNDEELQGAVKKFISALLPHENYDSSMFLSTLQLLFRYVRLEEFELEYYMLLKALNELSRLCTYFENYVPKLTESSFEELLEVSVVEAVTAPELGVREWLEYEGLDSNLANEMVKEQACQQLCQRSLALYEECFNLVIPSNEVLNYEPELKAAFRSAICLHSINAQVSIVKEGLRIGRRVYKGFDDWLEYSGLLNSEVASRLDDSAGDNVLSVDSAEASSALFSDLASSYLPIADWSIPEIDDRTPILRHRLVVIVANENVGKTQFSVDKAVNVMLAGGTVAFMCGESSKATVYGKVVINYVWKKYGIVLEMRHLLAPEDCPDDVRKMISMSVIEIVQEHRLLLVDAFDYRIAYSEIESLYKRYSFDALFIDHSCTLKGTVGDGSLHSKVSKLAEDVLAFKRKYPVAIIVNSHPSAEARGKISNSVEVTSGTTKGSNDLSANADEVFILESNSTLRKQSLVKFRNVKRRDASVVVDPIYLETKFEVSAFVYDKSRQGIDSDMSVERQEVLALLDEDCNDTLYNL